MQFSAGVPDSERERLTTSAQPLFIIHVFHVFKMADLVQRLLQNSSPSQLKTILSGYLDTPDCKRNGEFYCSLKSVLLSLQEHGEITDETIRRIYQDYCLPVLSKNFEERVVLYSVYELIVLCCAIGPNGLVHEVINACLESLSNCSKESMSPSGLPVVASLDLVSYLMKEGRSVVDEESNEKLFSCLLDVLCKSDELMCARISSGILPMFLIQDNGAATELRLQVSVIS